MIRTYLANAGFVLLDQEWGGVRGQYRYCCENEHVSSQTGASFMRLVPRAAWSVGMPLMLDRANLDSRTRCRAPGGWPVFEQAISR